MAFLGLELLGNGVLKNWFFMEMRVLSVRSYFCRRRARKCVFLWKGFLQSVVIGGIENEVFIKSLSDTRRVDANLGTKTYSTFWFSFSVR